MVIEPKVTLENDFILNLFALASDTQTKQSKKMTITCQVFIFP